MRTYRLQRLSWAISLPAFLLLMARAVLLLKHGQTDTHTHRRNWKPYLYRRLSNEKVKTTKQKAVRDVHRHMFSGDPKQIRHLWWRLAQETTTIGGSPPTSSEFVHRICETKSNAMLLVEWGWWPWTFLYCHVPAGRVSVARYRPSFFLEKTISFNDYLFFFTCGETAEAETRK